MTGGSSLANPQSFKDTNKFLKATRPMVSPRVFAAQVKGKKELTVFAPIPFGGDLWRRQPPKLMLKG